MRFTLHDRKGYVVQTVDEGGPPSMTHVITMRETDRVGLSFGDEVELVIPTTSGYMEDTVQRATVVGLVADVDEPLGF